MFLVMGVSEPLSISSNCFELYPVIEMVKPMGVFEHDFLILIESLDMGSFQRTILPSDEYLFETMIKVCHLAFVSSSWKP